MQLASLTVLHTLVLAGGNRRAGSHGVLQRLPRLRRLHCLRTARLPACLSRLTGLEELLLRAVGDAPAAALEQALRALTNLTSL